ncbi:MAG: preprotein translocase subunit Sec63 [Alphaproteobacteria bacterium]|jgi:preprotein translocase subunit Sec63
MIYLFVLIIIPLLLFLAKIKVLGSLFYFLPFLIRNISFFIKNNKTKNTQKKSNSSVYTLDEAAEVLGVRVDSSADEIELAYRKLMKKIHPDNGGSNYLAVKVNAAHDLLMNKFRNK